MIKLYNFDELRPEEILNRDIRAEKNVEDVVDGIIADVRARGDDALKDYALKFDGAKIDALQVTQEEIDEAFAGMDPYFLETLREAAANIESFHRQQVHKNFVVNDKPGIVLGQKYTPIEKAGVYVPGGTAAYPSTVLMDVIPAKVAGVSEIVMTTPAGKDGRVNPVILAAAATAGVTKIFKTGGAQAVAALAYGTQSIPAVDKIVGPGNIYVATAKRKVFGKVGIDMIAGPSEILVLADGGCNPAWVAADLLSQAEHDKLASPVLVTDSPELAELVAAKYPEVIFLPRGEELGGDRVPKMAVYQDSLHRMEERTGQPYDWYMDLDITSPLRTESDIENAFAKKQNRYDLDLVFSVCEARRNPWFNMVKTVDDHVEQVCKSEFTGRQQAPNVYDVNASIYVFKRDFLATNTDGMLWRGKIGISVMMDTGIIDIDSEHDYLLMEAIAQHLYAHYPEFAAVQENIRD